MTTEYKLRLFNSSGLLKGEITDFDKLSYTKVVNAPGIMSLGMSMYNLAVPNIAYTSQIEVWRKPEYQAWYRDFIGLTRKAKWSYQDGLPYVEYTAPGIIDMLRWRIVAWTANYANRSRFIGAAFETIANTLVKQNCNTAIGRLRGGNITGFTVEASGGYGGTIDWFCAYDNLLKTLQKLCEIGAGDFDVVKTSPTAWQWRWYDGQLGTDRSATVTFAMGLGNMADPEYEEDYITEATAAVVGGKGEDNNRATSIRTGANYDVSLNNTEIFVNASDADTTAGLDTAGDEKLAEVQMKPRFKFSVQQAPACLYGVHYFLGDITKAINPFTSSADKYKVQEVTVNVPKKGQEDIDVKLKWMATGV